MKNEFCKHSMGVALAYEYHFDFVIQLSLFQDRTLKVCHSDYLLTLLQEPSLGLCVNYYFPQIYVPD